MLRVRLEPSGASVRLGPGERLLDALDELPERPLDFPCRDASCGACTVEVLRGAALLVAPAADERALVGATSAPASVRLACQVRAGSAAGEVALRTRAGTA